MAGRTVVVLGGGVGGLVTANELRRRLGRSDRVVIVERSRQHLFQPSLLWLMVGRRRRERIETSVGALTGGAIVVALGAESELDAMPGCRDAACDIYSADGASGLCPGARDVPRWACGGGGEHRPVHVPDRALRGSHAAQRRAAQAQVT